MQLCCLQSEKRILTCSEREMQNCGKCADRGDEASKILLPIKLSYSHIIEHAQPRLGLEFEKVFESEGQISNRRQFLEADALTYLPSIYINMSKHAAPLVKAVAKYAMCFWVKIVSAMPLRYMK